MRTLTANSCAACTAIVVAMAGSTCRRLTRSEDTPFTRAASTYSRVRSDCARPRKIRYTGALSSTPSTVMIAQGCTPTAPTNASRMTIDGQREQQFGEPAEPALHPAAVLGGRQRERDADAEGDDDGEQRRAHRDPAARRDAGQQVAPELVGAEPVAARRAGQGVHRVLLVDRVRLPQRAPSARRAAAGRARRRTARRRRRAVRAGGGLGRGARRGAPGRGAHAVRTFGSRAASDEVEHQVRDDHDDRGDDDDALHGREVAVADRVRRGLAEARAARRAAR